MTKRLTWLLCGFLSLTAGAFLYGLFRQDTLIGKIVGTFLGFSLPINGLFSRLAAWFLPDYFWMLSLTCTFFAVMLPTGKNALLWCCLAFSFGALWEGLQLCGIVSGTADLWDIFVYSIAALTAAIIKLTKNEEKIE